jgi:hypothetical protein
VVFALNQAQMNAKAERLSVERSDEFFFCLGGLGFSMKTVGLTIRNKGRNTQTCQFMSVLPSKMPVLSTKMRVLPANM